MVTISVCMIVRNEEKCLARCLDGLKPIADEIIIVDTGSTDGTKKVAARYTDKIYDFEWIDDFSAARNFSFSKAKMDYIYTADADEVLDEENIKRFIALKNAMNGEFDAVTMTYVNRMEQNTVYNFERELRPKLFKRLRTLTWVDPIHETVRLDPLVFESDIEIMHIAHGVHAKRDFEMLNKAFKRDGALSKKLVDMYAKELFISGDNDDFFACEPVFEWAEEKYESDPDLLIEIYCVVARLLRLHKDNDRFVEFCREVDKVFETAEICCEMGEYFFTRGDFKACGEWYKKALGCESVLDIRTSGQIPREKLEEISK